MFDPKIKPLLLTSRKSTIRRLVTRTVGVCRCGARLSCRLVSWQPLLLNLGPPHLHYERIQVIKYKVVSEQSRLIPMEKSKVTIYVGCNNVTSTKTFCEVKLQVCTLAYHYSWWNRGSLKGVPQLLLIIAAQTNQEECGAWHVINSSETVWKCSGNFRLRHMQIITRDSRAYILLLWQFQIHCFVVPEDPQFITPFHVEYNASQVLQIVFHLYHAWYPQRWC